MKMRTTHFTLLLLLGLAACGKQTKQVSDNNLQKPAIQLINKPDKDIIDWGKQWETEKVGLNSYDKDHGVYALDSLNAFLFGSFRTAAATIQSFLLKTSDGGVTWKEVMSPVISNCVVDVKFSNPKLGYAILDNETEGPGPELLFYKTSDSGLTWEKMNNVIKPHYSCIPVSFQVSDTLLQLMFSCDGASPADGAYVFISRDNGKAWIQNEKMSLDEVEKRIDKTSSPYGKGLASTGLDKSYWLIDFDKTDSLEIYRTKINGDNLRLIGKISKTYNWQEGKIITF
jgi:hypothetical protein